MKLHFWFSGTSRPYPGQVQVSRSMGHVKVTLIKWTILPIGWQTLYYDHPMVLIRSSMMSSFQSKGHLNIKVIFKSRSIISQILSVWIWIRVYITRLSLTLYIAQERFQLKANCLFRDRNLSTYSLILKCPWPWYQFNLEMTLTLIHTNIISCYSKRIWFPTVQKAHLTKVSLTLTKWPWYPNLT